MMRRLAALPALILLAACAGYYGPSDDRTITDVPGGTLEIVSCTGGKLRQSVENFRTLEQQGTKVRIVGTAASACILLLRHSNVCYAPDAQFAFHGVTTGGVYDARMSRAFEDALPPKLSEWSRARGAMTDPAVFTILSGADLAALDDRRRVCG